LQNFTKRIQAHPEPVSRRIYPKFKEESGRQWFSMPGGRWHWKWDAADGPEGRFFSMLQGGYKICHFF